jgi:hypothetical protein
MRKPGTAFRCRVDDQLAMATDLLRRANADRRQLD